MALTLRVLKQRVLFQVVVQSCGLTYCSPNETYILSGKQVAKTIAECFEEAAHRHRCWAAAVQLFSCSTLAFNSAGSELWP